MCAVCGRWPCNPRCPNAEEPEIRYECADCGVDIMEGETLYEIMDKVYCAECVNRGKRLA